MLSEKDKRIINQRTRKMLKSKKEFKAMIDTSLSPEAASKVWKDAHKRLARMYAEHMGLPKGVRTHTDQYIFPAAAMYLAYKEVKPEQAFNAMKQVMADKSKKTGAFFAKCAKIPGFKSFFLSMWDYGSHKMFGEASGFKNVFYPKQKGIFKMDIIECPYHKYLLEQGCPELNGLFCDNDVYNYGSIPGMTFTRTQTIGYDGKLCDFKMELTRRKR